MMLIIFIPYYNEDTEEFKRSIGRIGLGGKDHETRTLRWNRREKGIYWSKACNEFYKELKRWRGLKDEDVICIMNNDISFEPEFIEEGKQVKCGEVWTGRATYCSWRHKDFLTILCEPFSNDSIQKDCTFPGRAFFMKYGDFKNSGGFSRLIKHALSDYDFGLRQVKRGMKIHLMGNQVAHHEHERVKSAFHPTSLKNPFAWTFFLLKHPNKYTPLNIAKAWYDAIK